MTNLRTIEERKRLLKAGWTTKEIEKHYIQINEITIINTEWTDK